MLAITYVCTWLIDCACVYAYVCAVCECVCAYVLCMSMCVCYVYVCVYVVYVYMCVCLYYVCMSMCVCVCVYAYMCVCAYMYVCACMCMYTHIHTMFSYIESPYREEKVWLPFALSKMSPLSIVSLNSLLERIVNWCWFYHVQALVIVIDMEESALYCGLLVIYSYWGR